REMGNVELLSREGEIKIAKRIESGRGLMLESLCETPIALKQFITWYDDLTNGQILLRDIIDLEASMGNDFPGEGENATPKIEIKKVEKDDDFEFGDKPKKKTKAANPANSEED